MIFVKEIEKIKDAVLEDQSKRFKSLEEIRDNSNNEIDSAIKNQLNKCRQKTYFT